MKKLVMAVIAALAFAGMLRILKKKNAEEKKNLTFFIKGDKE